MKKPKSRPGIILGSHYTDLASGFTGQAVKFVSELDEQDAVTLEGIVHKTFPADRLRIATPERANQVNVAQLPAATLLKPLRSHSPSFSMSEKQWTDIVKLIKDGRSPLEAYNLLRKRKGFGKLKTMPGRITEKLKKLLK